MLRKLVISIIIAVSVVVLAPIIIAVYLSPQDTLTKADAIVVISGGDTNARIDEGVKLYMQKWAPTIIYSGAAASGDVSNALAMKRISVSKGVPEESIILEEKAKTTKENAEYSSKIINDKGMNSIILVTSPYHQRRAYNEFKKHLGKDFKIINQSAIDNSWRKKNWWENANARFLTLGEILKNFYGIIENQ